MKPKEGQIFVVMRLNGKLYELGFTKESIHLIESTIKNTLEKHA